MSFVRPKKNLGQHFLKDESIARNIVDSLRPDNAFKKVLEIGPGTGVLTEFLLQQAAYETFLIEIDHESVDHLVKYYPAAKERIISGDFLRMKLEDLFSEPFAIIGNFPYNISSQILFKVLDHYDHVPQVVGMFQKEVAERIASGPGNKTYGILSVLLQAYYDIEYLFTVDEDKFIPPPKVKSAVIRLTRNKVTALGCDPALFKQIIKAGFNQRRKTLRNSLRAFHFSPQHAAHRFFSQRAEELSVKEFVELTNMVETKQ